MKSYFNWALLLCLLVWTCGSPNEPEPEVILRPVRYAAIGGAHGVGSISLSGVAQADRQTNLSFRVGGTIRDIAVKLGDRVRSGQLIATLDPIDYNIQEDQAIASEQGAVANLVAAENQLANARSNLERVELLYENNSVPLSDFEQAKLNFEGAQSNFDAIQSQVNSAGTQLQAARNQVRYTRITAPFSGVISAVNVEINELVGSGAPIVEISSEQNLEVSVGVPGNMITEVKSGQKVQVQFSLFPDELFAGTIRELSFIAGNSTTYPAIIRLDEDDQRIRPGMVATIILPSGNTLGAESLICPVAAVGQNEEGNFVFVLNDNQNGSYQVEQRMVKVGALVEEGFVLQEGLMQGELVATAGLRSLLDGMAVKLIE